MMLRMEAQFEVFADFHQFLARDADADWQDLADRWTPDAVDASFVQGDGYVAVGTARDMIVPVTVRLLSGGGSVTDQGTWDGCREGELAVLSGRLIVQGVTDNGASGGIVHVPPARYRVRVRFGGLDTISEDGLRGDDHYAIELTPMQ